MCVLIHQKFNSSSWSIFGCLSQPHGSGFQFLSEIRIYRQLCVRFWTWIIKVKVSHDKDCIKGESSSLWEFECLHHVLVRVLKSAPINKHKESLCGILISFQTFSSHSSFTRTNWVFQRQKSYLHTVREILPLLSGSVFGLSILAHPEQESFHFHHQTSESLCVLLFEHISPQRHRHRQSLPYLACKQQIDQSMDPPWFCACLDSENSASKFIQAFIPLSVLCILDPIQCIFEAIQMPNCIKKRPSTLIWLRRSLCSRSRFDFFNVCCNLARSRREWCKSLESPHWGCKIIADILSMVTMVNSDSASTACGLEKHRISSLVSCFHSFFLRLHKIAACTHNIFSAVIRTSFAEQTCIQSSEDATLTQLPLVHLWEKSKWWGTGWLAFDLKTTFLVYISIFGYYSYMLTQERPSKWALTQRKNRHK